MKKREGGGRRAEAQAKPGRDRLFVAITFAVYVALTLWVGLHHEPWRDEADPWLLMRDGGVTTMLARVGYVGMPPLWYLLLAPLPKLGLPYVSLTILHLVVAWGAMLVFLRLAPFPRTLKVLFALSYFASFEYAVVARPYALAVLLLFGIAALWGKRHEHPIVPAILIALLALTTTHTLFFAAALGLVFLIESFRERRFSATHLIALAIMVAGGGLSAWLLRPPAAMESSHVIRTFSPEGLRWAFANAFFPDVPGHWPLFFSAAILFLVALAIGKRLGPQLFLWGSVAALAFIYIAVWVAGLRHSGLIVMLAVAALWLASHYEAPGGSGVAGRIAVTALGVSFAYSSIVALQYWKRDIAEPFSGSKEMAEFIVRNDLQRFEIAAHLPTVSEALLPYLGTRFYYPGIYDYGSYMLWDTAYNVATHVSYGDAVTEAQRRFAGQPWLLLVNQEMKFAERAGFRLLYTNQNPPFEYRDENYWLYAPLDWPAAPLPPLR